MKVTTERAGSLDQSRRVPLAGRLMAVGQEFHAPGAVGAGVEVAQDWSANHLQQCERRRRRRRRSDDLSLVEMAGCLVAVGQELHAPGAVRAAVAKDGRVQHLGECGTCAKRSAIKKMACEGVAPTSSNNTALLGMSLCCFCLLFFIVLPYPCRALSCSRLLSLSSRLKLFPLPLCTSSHFWSRCRAFIPPPPSPSLSSRSTLQLG